MSFDKFKAEPWKESHPRYRESVFAVSPAPEYANSEVLLSSLYRAVGFSSLKEGLVSQAGRDLDKELQKRREKGLQAPDDAIANVETWNATVHGILESPKLPNQSSKRFVQITPLVPTGATFSGAARLSHNPWNPGALIKRMILLGAADLQDAQKLWRDLFDALTVDSNDDIFARWIEREAAAWSDKQHIWKYVELDKDSNSVLSASDYSSLLFLPARQFNRDLKAIIGAKSSMTRKQWTSLLESVLRLATVSHVLWLCDTNSRITNCLFEVLNLDLPPKSEEDIRTLVFPSSPQYMAYGGKALQDIKDKISSYLSSRLGLNTILWMLDDIGCSFKGELSSSAGLLELCQLVHRNKSTLKERAIFEQVQDIKERESRSLLCKKGIGSNLFEFARHVLGKRQTANQLLRGYDQGYILTKKGTSNASPWVVSVGPVAVLSFVHCALAGASGPRSIQRLVRHFSSYGLVIDRNDIVRNDLGYQLRMLGLVLDSPDAESGMLLLPPFNNS
ncbi:hypothetical protein [Rheinheimera faecalis]